MPHKKNGSFCGRTCVVLATAGILGSLYLLANCYSSDDQHNFPTYYNATQFTNKTGFPAPNEYDLYCTYSDQNLPRQMADFVSAGIIDVIEQAGTFIYQGARLTFECINNGMLWRQYIDESHCVFMDHVTCRALGGNPFRDGSRCIEGLHCGLLASQDLCSLDEVDVCKWRN